MENLPIIYNYDRDTREFTGSSKAKQDPKVEDRFLMPANSTLVVAPAEQPNKKAIFDIGKEKWDYVDDYRGTEVSAPDETGRTVVIQALGIKPDDIVFDPLPEQTYKDVRAAMYPDIGDQLDAIMKWAATETEIGIPTELKSIAMQCMNVKSQVPKE